MSGPHLTTQRVGRLLQDEFLTAMCLSDEARSMISRDHFQIWAQEETGSDGSSASSGSEGVAFTFILRNMSTNWTVVNSSALRRPGEQATLHDGDVIAIGRNISSSGGIKNVPFVKFKFDLSGSTLRQGKSQQAAVPDVQLQPRASSRPPVPVVPSQQTPAHQAVQFDRAPLGTSLVGEIRPWFVLEMRGQGLKEGLESEASRIVHGPPLEENGDSSHFSPLVLGRGHSTGFWRRALTDEAYNALSREHLRIEALQGPPGEPVLVVVRNLSALNPICVHSSLEDVPRDPLKPDDLQRLTHGDFINVNCHLWFAFQDLRHKTSDLPRPACAVTRVGSEARFPGVGGA